MKPNFPRPIKRERVMVLSEGLTTYGPFGFENPESTAHPDRALLTLISQAYESRLGPMSSDWKALFQATIKQAQYLSMADARALIEKFISQGQLVFSDPYRYLWVLLVWSWKNPHILYELTTRTIFEPESKKKIGRPPKKVEGSDEIYLVTPQHAALTLSGYSSEPTLGLYESDLNRAKLLGNLIS